MADNYTLARPYAQAAFEIASASRSLDKWSQALGVASDVLRDGQAARFLATPTVTDEDRLSFLVELFKSAAGKTSVLAGGSEHGTNFLKLLIENGRVPVLREIAEHFDALKANVENTLNVTVTSAAPLSAAQKTTVAKALKEKLGREVILATKIDENLIGGAVISAGDVVIDGSLRSRLESLSNALIS